MSTKLEEFTLEHIFKFEAALYGYLHFGVQPTLKYLAIFLALHKGREAPMEVIDPESVYVMLSCEIGGHLRMCSLHWDRHHQTFGQIGR